MYVYLGGRRYENMGRMIPSSSNMGREGRREGEIPRNKHLLVKAIH